MRKITVVAALAGALFSAQGLAATSGISGSAGFGIDLAGLTVASGGGTPAAALPPGALDETTTLGGPITGLAKKANRIKP